MTDLSIQRIEEARLTAEEEAEISVLLNSAFDTDFGVYSYYHQRHHVRLTARDGGQLVGHMALGLRCVRLGNEIVDIAALGEVATHPDWQGRGVASRLMTATLAEAEAMPAEFVVLFGDEKLYFGTGFEPKTNQMTWLDLDGRRSVRLASGTPDKLMVRSLGAAEWDDAAPLDLMGHKF